MRSKQLKKRGLENGLYEQLVMIHRRESDNKKENDKEKHLTSKENQQELKVSLILIMSG